MSDKKNTIVDEALLDMEQIKEALKTNSKEILRSILKEEIEGYMKESLTTEDEDYEEEEIEDGGEEGETEEPETVDTDPDTEEGETEIPELPLDSEESEEEEVQNGEEEFELPLDLDLTNASDEDVIAVYKKLSGEDEIEVISDKKVEIKDPESGNEYIVTLGDEDETEETTPIPDVSDETETPDELELEPEEDELEENIVYEITLDEADLTETNEETVEESTESEEDEEKVEEKIQVGKGRTVANNSTEIKGAGGDANKVKEPNVTANESYEAKYNALLTESNKLKTQNSEFKNALKEFRVMLNKNLLFNTNLTHVVKLFTEHATTKDEKKQIIDRFDKEVSSIKESKNLYKNLISDLSSKKPVTESVDEKINKTNTSSKTQITESTAYIDPEVKNIIDLMDKLDSRKK